ncbi:hypothetical protein Cni_G22817 [Canna indica]|uniref:Uncharacterized protein n=1 Tax=Canna indica TaxID=4628 RepID=A0AAQ3KRY4_9LILI|nr:hypothetical protein Cni_G22817 [Canna indica]
MRPRLPPRLHPHVAAFQLHLPALPGLALPARGRGNRGEPSVRFRGLEGGRRRRRSRMGGGAWRLPRRALLIRTRVFPVRLGKFKSLGDGNGDNDDDDDEGGDVSIAIGNGRFDEGETSSSSLEVRRCFSMGSYQYVVIDANLQVAFKNCSAIRNGRWRGREARESCTENEAVEGNRPGIGGQRESKEVPLKGLKK